MILFYNRFRKVHRSVVRLHVVDMLVILFTKIEGSTL